MRSDSYNIKDNQQLKKIAVTLNVLTKIVTPAITLLMKQYTLNVMQMVENKK